MFVSRRRPIVFTQYEHMRLAGEIARCWGNESFPRPPLPFDAFVAGVALHDFGYGVLDNHSIGDMPRQERLQTLRALVDTRLDDPIAETVSLFHAARLIDDNDPALLARCHERIDALLDRTGVDRAAHEAADRITDLCDSIAFHFCFEVANRGYVAVPGGARMEDTTSVRWHLDETGGVRLEPWPLGCPDLDISLIAFRAHGYPESLQPLLVSCRVEPGDKSA